MDSVKGPAATIPNSDPEMPSMSSAVAAGCRTRIDSTWINFMPMFHATGCAMITLGALRVGCRMVLMALFGPESVVRQIERERVTSILGVPTMVVGLPDEKWGEVIGCFIRSEDDAPLDIEDLRRHCRANLSPQKTRTVWCRVDEFPLTGFRKIQKFRLREQFLAGEYEAQ